MKIRLAATVLTIFVLATFGIAVEGEPATGCFCTLASGSGANYLSWCVSSTGNLQLFQSPAGENQIGVPGEVGEGYAICTASGVSGYDAGGLGATAGWVDVSISQPNGPNKLPLTIVRNTPDGKFQLKLTFAQNTTYKSVTLTMALKNISGVTQSNVQLSRYADFYLDNINYASFGEITFDSVVVSGVGNGMLMTGLTFATSSGVAVQAYPGTYTDCNAVSDDSPTGTGHWTGKVVYNLGDIKSGVTKTVKIDYRRI